MKILLDAARAADEKVNGIMAEMSAAFEAGTPEGVERAMGMRDDLAAAKAEAERANEVYVTARDIQPDPAEASANARKFVPVNEKTKREMESKKEMTRAEFEALSAADKMDFMLADGHIVE